MAGREVQTQIELGLAGRQTIPSGGFQYLQLGVFMRRPEIVDISRAAPRRVHDLHRRRTRRRLHRAHIGAHRPIPGPGLGAHISTPPPRNPQLNNYRQDQIHNLEPSQDEQ
jgi:hypothetical protein